MEARRYRPERVAVALLQHKETLLQEMQRRVGNSLQIIASILALDARKVRSVEARLHLENAYRRILAVATVQQQLQTSREFGEFELAAYLRKLCDNLTASVVGDTTRIAIDVQADAVTVSSTVAMNMGLIVTELVINAIKHAFVADMATGQILVTYRVGRKPAGRLRFTITGSASGTAIGTRRQPAWERTSSRRWSGNSTPA